MNFSDLPDSNWAYSYVSYLYCDGVVSGYADGTFRPNAGSSRGQFAKMLVLGMGWYPYEAPNPTFTDVPPGSTFYTYIESAYLHGAVAGYSDGRFRPNNPVTRAQATKMLVLGKGWPLQSPQTPTFTDVPSSSWAYSYVETAVRHGVAGGFVDGTFRPDQPVSRAQLSKMVVLTMRAAGAAAQPQPDPTATGPVVKVAPNRPPK